MGESSNVNWYVYLFRSSEAVGRFGRKATMRPNPSSLRLMTVLILLLVLQHSKKKIPSDTQDYYGQQVETVRTVFRTHSHRFAIFVSSCSVKRTPRVHVSWGELEEFAYLPS